MSLNVRKERFRIDYTVHGSLLDKTLDMLISRGEMTLRDCTKAVIEVAGDKQRAASVLYEMQRRGFVEKRVCLNELAISMHNTRVSRPSRRRKEKKGAE